MEFALLPNSDGNLYVFESGVNRGVVSSYTTADVFRVAVEGGVVKYRRNGTLVYTSTVAPVYETGLDYLIHRYYHPTSGRFTSPDVPFAQQWEVDPQSWNLYAYVGNQPLNFTDPFGLWKQVPCIGTASQCWKWEEGDDWSSLGVDAGLGNGAGKALAKYFSYSNTQLGADLVVDLSGFMDWYNGLNPVQRVTLREFEVGPPMGGGLHSITKPGPSLISRIARWFGLARSGQSASRNIGGITAQQAERLRELLEKIPGAVKVRAFGSRTTGAFSKDSDLDIVILGNVDKANPNTIRAVQEAQRYAESIGIGMGKGYRSLDISIYRSVQEMQTAFRSMPSFNPSLGLPKLVGIQ